VYALSFFVSVCDVDFWMAFGIVMSRF
jgi:hypothetical protein